METKRRKIQQLTTDEEIPYNLLLLADETIEAINEYIYNSEIYILEENNRIIAVYVLQKLNVEEAEIKNIAVVPEYQGKGIGKLLLRDATERTKAEGFKTIIIGTGDAGNKQL